mgnify:CR=1 FL=1
MTSITTENASSTPKNYVINQWDDEVLDLKPNLLRGIYAFGFEKPSAIQQKALYPMTSRPAKDIIAQAQSGTGKTGAFVTGTFAGIIPVSKIDNRNLKSTNSNSLVNRIRFLYNEYIQENIN